MPSSLRPPAIARALLIAGFYLALALWCVRVVLPGFASTIPTGTDVPAAWQQITAADQKLVVAVVTAHGRTLLDEPSTLLDGPQCHPLRRALMLGQHELGEGLLGLVPYALSRDPVVTYNVVVILSLALAGLAMHALVFDWTGSGAAAFVAGTAFATHPARIGDIVHLSAIGNYWTAVTLLCLVRLFTRRTWTAAIALGLAAAAQTLESIYPLIPHAIVCGTVGGWLVWRHRRELPLLAPKLALAAGCIIGAAVLVLGPYLQFRATWGSLAGRDQMLYALRDFGPGGGAFSGTIVLVLASLGILDRIRHRAAGAPPFGALLVAGLLVLWAAVAALPVPGLGAIPSLFAILGTIVPGLDAVRRGGVVVSGWHLVVIVFAGYGVAALVRGRNATLRMVLGGGLAALVLTEVFVPAVARATFGRSVALRAYVVRPSDAVRALYAQVGPGAVLDVPYELGPGRFYRMADFVLAGAYHGHRVAACYNSFRVAVQEDIVTYAARVLSDARAAEALAALDIRNVVYHLGLPSRLPLPPPAVTPPHLIEVGRAGTEVLYRIPATPTVTEQPSALATRIEVSNGDLSALVFRNDGAELYRHPDPIEPTLFTIRWYGPDDSLLGETRTPLLLPTVLPAGDELRRGFASGIHAPAATARVSLATAADPDHVLASLAIGR